MSNSLKLIEITDKNKWNDFVGAQSHAEFLQSFEWGEFQEKVEGKIMRLGVEDEGKIIAVGMLIKKSLPLKMNYFYCPRGIIINEELKVNQEVLFNFFFAEIKKIAEKEKVIFLRFEPKKKIQNSKFKIQNSLDVQPSKTIMLDLSKSEEVLLATMHQKTRYNIRLAEKKGVIIREAGVDEFDKFWALMSETVDRDGFRLHGREYYLKMLSSGNQFLKLFFGIIPSSLGEGGAHESKVICSGIFSFFGDTAVYIHGASSNENREVMAPYLLQWEMIKRAKAGGCKFYDFCGIDEKKWPGVTRFKRGFSGMEVKYPGTFDAIFDRNKYFLYTLFRKIRRFF
jgi:lipid II:glycine glycyltransferase (peptidoglycan interpeptide bridge formation enzyme)